MADSVFHSVASMTDYTVPYGVYPDNFGNVLISWAFDVYITIYETPRWVDGVKMIGELHCAFPSNGSAVARFVAGPRTGDGAGFWNAAGIMWGDGTFVAQKSLKKLPPYGSDTDSYEEMLVQLDAATSDYFARFAFYDKDSDPQLFQWNPMGANFTRLIRESELDSEGNLPSLVLAKLFTRFYDNDHADYDTGYPYGPAVVLSTEITSQAMNIDWRYYPWSVKVGGSWLSCNRDYNTISENRNAYLRIKDGSFRDVLNWNQLPTGETQKSWVKRNNDWQRALPTGTGA